MSLLPSRVITVANAAALAAYRGRLGDIVVAQDFSGGGVVTDPSSAPTPLGGSFTPANDNATDLGDATHRFRSLYLGTSIKNAGDLACELSGGATRTFAFSNPTGGQVANVTTDGSFIASVGLSAPLWTFAGNADIDLAAGTTTLLRVRNSGAGLCDLETDGVIKPAVNNSQDLGAPDTGSGFFAWRSLYLFTSIESDATFAIRCTSGGTSQVQIINPTIGQVCDLYVSGAQQLDGEFVFGGGAGGIIRSGFVNTNLFLHTNGSGVTGLRNPGNTATLWGVQGFSLLCYSDTQTGAGPTIDRPSGVVRVPSGSTSVVVSNNLVTTASMVHATIKTVTTNAVSVLSAVPGAGTITLTLSGDPGVSDADVAFLVINPS